MMLERRLWLIVKPWLQEEQFGLHPSHGTLDMFYTLSGLLKGLLKLSQPVKTFFQVLDKAFDGVPHGNLWVNAPGVWSLGAPLQGTTL